MYAAGLYTARRRCGPEARRPFKLDNQNAILSPNTKAHGFLTLEPNTIVCYLVDNKYAPGYEHSIVWNTIPEVEKIVKSYAGDNMLTISEKDTIGK